MDRFVIFIISYMRPDRQYTLKMLTKKGYTGDWYIVIGEDDPMKGEYLKRYGDRVLVFDKRDYRWIDLYDTDEDLVSTIFARNAVYDLAEKLGYEYFFIVDDDIEDVRFSQGCVSNKKDVSLDRSLGILLDFYRKTKVDVLGISQTGDFIGGKTQWRELNFEEVRQRKAMCFMRFNRTMLGLQRRYFALRLLFRRVSIALC
ncbi:MAG: hypothetical protein ACPL3B_08825 [Fervidobacterium sp.]